MSYTYNVKRGARASRERAKRNAETARLLGPAAVHLGAAARAGLALKKVLSGVSGALILVSLLWMFAACNLQRCSEGAACAISNGAGPSAIPSPTVAATATPSPSPSPTVKAESCAIEYMVLQPRDGLTLAKDQSGRLSLTPYQTVTNPDGTVAQREVSEACNLPRIPAIVWTSSSAAVIVGTGFEPIVTRVGVGVAQVTATLEGKVSNAVVIR